MSARKDRTAGPWDPSSRGTGAGVEQGWREVLEVSEAQMLGLSPLPSCSLELFCLILCLPIQHWEVRSVTAEVRSHLHQYLRQPAALLLCYILGCGVFGL